MNTNYDTAINELEGELTKLKVRVEGLRFAIETLKTVNNGSQSESPLPFKSNGVSNLNLFNEENSTITPVERTELVFNAILNLGRYSKLKTIVAYLDKKFDANQIRLSLINLYKDQLVDKIQPTTSNEDTFYGLSIWKDGNSIKTEHNYNRKELAGSKMK